MFNLGFVCFEQADYPVMPLGDLETCVSTSQPFQHPNRWCTVRNTSDVQRLM
jgi:hypothetical protein